MNVGTRYPEGRIGRPREIGGRHVRKEEKGLRKGGPEGLRKAHEARAGHGPEDAGAQGVVQGDRGELGRLPSTVSAEVASHRFATAPKARRGERVDASADLSAPCPRLAAWPRCCNGCGRYRACLLYTSLRGAATARDFRVAALP